MLFEPLDGSVPTVRSWCATLFRGVIASNENKKNIVGVGEDRKWVPKLAFQREEGRKEEGGSHGQVETH